MRINRLCIYNRPCFGLGLRWQQEDSYYGNGVNGYTIEGDVTLWRVFELLKKDKTELKAGYYATWQR